MEGTMDVREKAIERVADELHDATNAGVLFDRIWFRVPFNVRSGMRVNCSIGSASWSSIPIS
jgi:hypothetical protein